jgi:ParB-like chromosome segregation protein Spo0J
MVYEVLSFFTVALHQYETLSFPKERKGSKMASKKNKACTLKIGQIEKDPILALDTSEKDVEKYGRVAKAYGNVVPAIVGQSGKAYHILSGQARLEACVHHGIEEMPVIITEINEEAEQMKLALLLSTVREEGGALSEGAFIDALLTHHGVTRRELMGLLKKSKSWISKRQLLAIRLSGVVKGMVKDGVICARSAEEIAKLPEEVQVNFAGNVVRDGLSKSGVGQLVSLYTRSESDSVLRDAILDSPLTVLDAYPAGPAARRIEKRGIVERIAGNTRFLIRLIYELKGLLATAEVQSIDMVSTHLGELRKALTDLCTVLDWINTTVPPGKPKPQGSGAP